MASEVPLGCVGFGVQDMMEKPTEKVMKNEIKTGKKQGSGLRARKLCWCYLFEKNARREIWVKARLQVQCCPA